MLSELLRRARDERGMTITELLIAASLLLVVVSAALTLIPMTLQNEERVRDKAGAVQEGRTLVERLTRELRQGSAVVGTPTASTLSFSTYVHRASCGGAYSSAAAIQCRITYSCGTAGTCTRTERNLDGSGTAPAQTLVTGLANVGQNGGTGFSYQPDASAPGHVTVRLVFPGETADDAITLEDGASLRNLPPAV